MSDKKFPRVRIEKPLADYKTHLQVLLFIFARGSVISDLRKDVQTTASVSLF